MNATSLRQIGRPLLMLIAALVWALPVVAQHSGPISPERLANHVKVLAAAQFAGRAPGGPGESKTVKYLIDQFGALGLKPAGEHGGWTQTVPLVRIQLQPGAVFSLGIGDGHRTLEQGRDVMVETVRPIDRVVIKDAPLVFVGYGVTAPERGWDDFKGIDLAGKIAVFLINDPDFEATPGEPVDGKFGGRAATYYARWTYKFEEAVRRGALGALIVHETPAAGYPWSTVVASSGESYDVVRPNPARERLLMQGWIQRELAVEVFRAAGIDFEAQKILARRADFRPVQLGGAVLSAHYRLKSERLISHNVLAAITGTRRPTESVMFAAHWDAFGVGPADANGDTIRHGADDDGTGVAAVLELAHAFARGPRPERSLVFAAWTAEERGLLGSEYYAAHPTLPLATTVADFTVDILQTAGPSRDVVLVGSGQNDLEGELARAAARQGRTVTPDAHPERALYYRADHLSLARRGVPTLLLMAIGGGPDLLDGGPAAGEHWVTDYTSHCYHQVCDNWSPAWDLRGAADDVELLYDVGMDLANSTRWPAWYPGSEFKSMRDRTSGRIHDKTAAGSEMRTNRISGATQ